MPDKCMLFKDNIGELSRASRLTREVPFFSLDPSEQDVIQMMQQGCKRGGRIAPAVMRGMRFLAVAVMVAVVASCATLKPDSPNEEKVKLVTERATARWQAIIGKDFAAAYAVPVARVAVGGDARRDSGPVASRVELPGGQWSPGLRAKAETCRVRLSLTYNAAVAHQGRRVDTDEQRPYAAGWSRGSSRRVSAWYVWPV